MPNLLLVKTSSQITFSWKFPITNAAIKKISRQGCKTNSWEVRLRVACQGCDIIGEVQTKTMVKVPRLIYMSFSTSRSKYCAIFKAKNLLVLQLGKGIIRWKVSYFYNGTREIICIQTKFNLGNQVFCVIRDRRIFPDILLSRSEKPLSSPKHAFFVLNAARLTSKRGRHQINRSVEPQIEEESWLYSQFIIGKVWPGRLLKPI